MTEDNLLQAMADARKTYDKVTSRNYEADSGAAVVMDVHTGRIVAMASAPSYDPNLWAGGISGKDYQALTSKESNFPLLNRAIQGQSAPGSTFKVISTTAAVQAGYSLDGTYPCPTSLTIGGREFKNFEAESFGSITLEKALEVSCDTVFYGLAYDQWMKDGGIKPKKDPGDWFYKTAHQFGLGAKTGIDLLGRGDRTGSRPAVEAVVLRQQQGRLVRAGGQGRQQLLRPDRQGELRRRLRDARR